jgi:hypothetical protein
MEWVVNAKPRSLCPRERPRTQCIEGWVGPRAVLDGRGKSRHHRDSIPGPSRKKLLKILQRILFRILRKILSNFFLCANQDVGLSSKYVWVATSPPPPEKSAACQYVKYTDVDGFHGNKTASKNGHEPWNTDPPAVDSSDSPIRAARELAKITRTVNYTLWENKKSDRTRAALKQQTSAYI